MQLKDDLLNDESFEMNIRVLGNEVLGFQIKVNDFKTKWVIISTMLFVVITTTFATYGEPIVQMFR